MPRPYFSFTVLGTCVYYDKDTDPTHFKSFAHAWEFYLSKLKA